MHSMFPRPEYLSPAGGAYGVDQPPSPYWNGLPPWSELNPWSPVRPLQSFQEVRYLRQLVCDLVEQNCRSVRSAEPDYIDSGFISTHAEAIRYLCEHGLMTMVNDGFGRCVQAKSIPYYERITK